MTLVDIHHKYLEVTLISYENIQKANWGTFFRPHSSCRRDMQTLKSPLKMTQNLKQNQFRFIVGP